MNEDQIIQELLSMMNKYPKGANFILDISIRELANQTIYFDCKPIIERMENEGMIYYDFKSGNHKLMDEYRST